MTIIEKTSPNKNERPATAAIDCIVIHADAAPNEHATISWVQSAQSHVSYHYLIGRDGRVYRFVPEEKRAWHAGVSSFAGRTDCNSYSIGVSFSNDQKDEPFPEVQIAAGVELCADIMRRRPAIILARIVTHAACALPEGRKHDPGPLFQWQDFIGRIGAALAAGFVA